MDKRILFILIGAVAIVAVGVAVVLQKRNGSVAPTPTLAPISINSVKNLLEIPFDKEPENIVISGIVKTGAQIDREYCSEGLYLTDDTGAIQLQLRVKDEAAYSKMLDDAKYLRERVEVRGKYPAQQVFCEALICQCENYLLMDSILIIE